jgi:hypothetical protein
MFTLKKMLHNTKHHLNTPSPVTPDSSASPTKSAAAATSSSSEGASGTAGRGAGTGTASKNGYGSNVVANVFERLTDQRNKVGGWGLGFTSGPLKPCTLHPEPYALRATS